MENAALVILLGALMLLAVAQIVLRVFFSFGFVWADELIKLFVLWIALIASIAASNSSSTVSSRRAMVPSRACRTQFMNPTHDSASAKEL